jgi:chemotaxis methyl-accepting protein methylase
MNKITKQGASELLAPYYQYHPKCYCRLCLKLRKKISYKQQATSQEATSSKRLLVILLDNLIIRFYKMVKERIL